MRKACCTCHCVASTRGTGIKGDSQEAHMLRSLAVVITGSVLGVSALAQGQFGTAVEARAMLDKAVAAVKADKSKALDQMQKGENGFKDRDLYTFCANASDGILTAHPALKGTKMETIKDKDGKVNAVIIGVGGFLGMGEHDIAVTMDKLKFHEEPVRTSSAAPGTTRETTTGTGTAPANTTTTTTTTTTARSADTNDWTPDHAVMNGTKEQLKAMPQFKYSDYN